MTDSPNPLEVLMLPDRYIPDDWSPEQALAVYAFLDDLQERIRDLYHDQLIEQYRIDCGGEEHDRQLDLEFLPFNDDVSF